MSVATGEYFLTVRLIWLDAGDSASGHIQSTAEPGPIRPQTSGFSCVGTVPRMPRSSSSQAVGTLSGVLAASVVALLVWVVAAPRSELLSVGGGRGLRLPDSGTDGGSQLLMLIVLLSAAVVCSVLVLWHRHPGLRRPRGVPALVLLPGLACAVAAAAATPLAGVLASPPSDAPYGVVVAQAPAAGALFFDRMIYGTAGPSWDWFPPGAGWVMWGAMVAAFTVAGLAHFSHSPDLRDDLASASEVAADPATEPAEPAEPVEQVKPTQPAPPA